MNTLQQRIIEDLQVCKEIEPEQEVRKRVDFLKSYLLAHPFLKSYVLGISGGQDSTLAGKLAQMAVEELRKETNESYQFIAVRLPYGSQKDESDATRALSFISPDQTYRVDIKNMVDSVVSELEKNDDINISDFNKGNIKARQRMVSQYAIAGECAGAVIGTDHAAENITGFFTKFGDGGADILPLFGLTKNQGKELLRELGADACLYEKIPTADLEDNRPMLSDEAALGLTYAEIDSYLTGETISSESQDKLEQLFHKTEHKRHLPITMGDTFWKK